MDNKALKIIIGSALIAFVTIIFVKMKGQDNFSDQLKKIKINNVLLFAEVAYSPQKQSVGLSGREFLGENEAMIFEYKDKEIRHFWMKEMRFPIDVMWISDSVVVGVQENIPIINEDGSEVRFSSLYPVNFVIEVNSGWVRRNKVLINNRVDILAD